MWYTAASVIKRTFSILMKSSFFCNSAKFGFLNIRAPFV